MKTENQLIKKTQYLLFVCMITFVLFTIAGCDIGPKKETVTRNVYGPEYLSYEDLRSAVRTSQSTDLSKIGKIYLKDNYIFINEELEGVHIIDNTDPSAPQNIGFITIPGNIDIAIRDNILYADSYTDLVAIDITDPKNTTVTKRIEGIFALPEYYYYEDEDYDPNGRYEPIDNSKGIFLGWEVIGTETYEVETNHGYYEDGSSNQVDMPMAADSSGGSSNESMSERTTGTGGSLACFTIVNSYLYVLTGSNMQLFNISEPENPTVWSNINVGWDIETLFPYEDKLFIGAQSGLYIYDNSDPSNPVLITKFSHATSCDPVVVQGNYAFVTLRGGNSCGGWDNQLDIIDISSIDDPVLIKSYSMQNPYGLGIDGDIIFICDGSAGLKIYNASDYMNLELIVQIDDITPHDVILNNGIAIVISSDALYLYDYSNVDDINLLSKVSIL